MPSQIPKQVIQKRKFCGGMMGSETIRLKQHFQSTMPDVLKFFRHILLQSYMPKIQNDLCYNKHINGKCQLSRKMIEHGKRKTVFDVISFSSTNPPPPPWSAHQKKRAKERGKIFIDYIEIVSLSHYWDGLFVGIFFFLLHIRNGLQPNINLPVFFLLSRRTDFPDVVEMDFCPNENLFTQLKFGRTASFGSVIFRVIKHAQGGRLK